MRELKVKALQKETFCNYGDFYDLLSPSGYSLGDFYHDRVPFPAPCGQQVAFSALVCSKRESNIIDSAESHSYATELLVPLDGDVIIHVAPPSVIPVPELTEAFLVPKGTLVTLRVGVWHLAPFAVQDGNTHLLIGLPERTYKTDCEIATYEEDQYMIVNYSEEIK